MATRVGLFLGMLALGCAGAEKRQNPGERRAAAEPALLELRAGRFAEASQTAGSVLAADAGNGAAAVTRALAGYVGTMHALVEDATRVIEGANEHGFDHASMRAAFERTEQGLAAADADLGVAAADAEFALELCLACWDRDWNRSGEIDERDRLLFQIELDAAGNELPEGDPRRMPTFRFDVGDVHWARAMIAFQRAGLNLLLAYRWDELDKLLGMFGRGSELPVIRIRLGDAARVERARQLILAGLDHADRTRTAYLAETDDDREWVPNPRQQSHPLPLPVDQALYDTWEGVVGDLRRIIAREEGLGVAEIAQLGDHQWETPPRGFIDLGRMLAEPRDILFDLAELGRIDGDANPEAVLRSIFSIYYIDTMKPSPLVGRFRRMKGEIERGDDSFERKMRYLFWLN